MHSSDVKYLAERIRDDVFTPVNIYKTTIFLCGAAIDDRKSLRGKLTELLSKKRYSYQYDIIYPEDIFEELMYGVNAMDLLSLENMLAENVDAIIIIPESSGSFAELGAFTNDINLREKIICIQDKIYKKKRTFINYGPIKLLKKSKLGKVITVDPENLENDLAKIRKALSEIKKASIKNKNTIGLIQLENYLLPSIYLLEPIDLGFLAKLVGFVINDSKNVYQKTKTALSILTKKKLITKTTKGYELTSLGNDYFRKLKKTGRVKYNFRVKLLDSIRLDIMNWKYRNKKIKKVNRMGSS